ncbi:MAG: hypothetical protein ACOCR6_01905 [archaeon]
MQTADLALHSIWTRWLSLKRHGEIAEMGVDEFEQRVNLFPSTILLSRLLVLVPVDVPRRFEFGKMNTIQFQPSLVAVVGTEARVF